MHLILRVVWDKKFTDYIYENLGGDALVDVWRMRGISGRRYSSYENYSGKRRKKSVKNILSTGFKTGRKVDQPRVFSVSPFTRFSD